MDTTLSDIVTQADIIATPAVVAADYSEQLIAASRHSASSVYFCRANLLYTHLEEMGVVMEERLWSFWHNVAKNMWPTRAIITMLDERLPVVPGVPTPVQQPLPQPQPLLQPLP